MPSTLPTHPLAVLPLKLWRPRWFDGVALATGACAPDFAYALHGLTPRIPGHTVPALLWWCLPTAVAVAWLIRRAAPAVAAHLPGWMRDWGVLGTVRHPWLITAWSAVLGAASHLAWDLVTHPGPVAAWWPIRKASDCSALVLMPLFIWYCGSRRLVRAWHGAPPPVRRRPLVFWTATVAATAAGLLATWLLGDGHLAWFGYPQHPEVVGVRVFTAATLGPMAGAVAVRLAAVQSRRAAGNRPPAAAPLPR